MVAVHLNRRKLFCFYVSTCLLAISQAQKLVKFILYATNKDKSADEKKMRVPPHYQC